MKKIAAVILAGLFLVSVRAFPDELEGRLAAANKQNMPVLLEFGADWCIPCQQLRPVIKRVEDAYRGKLSVIVIDTDRSREQAARYNIRVLPTLVFLDTSGKEYKRLFGGGSYEEIAAVLKTAGI